MKQSSIQIFNKIWKMLNIKNIKVKLIAYLILISISLPIESIIFPYIVLSKISSLSPQNLSKTKVIKLSFYFVIIFSVLKILNFIRRRIGDKLQNQMYIDVKRNIFIKIMNIYKQVQHELPLGRIISHMENVPFLVEEIIYKVIEYILPDTMCLISVIGFLFYLDVVLGIIGFVFTILYILFLVTNIRKPQIKAKKEAKYRVKHNQGILNTLDNMLYILVNNSFNFETKNFDKHNQNHLKCLNDCEKVNSTLFGYMDIGEIIFLIFIVVRLYFLILNNRKNESQLIKYTSLFVLLIFFLEKLYDLKYMVTDISNNLQQSQVFIEDMRELKFQPDKKDLIDKNIPSESISPNENIEYSIRIKNITYKYPNTCFPTLSGKSFNFYRNKITAIQGPSGCGKTTLVKILLGLLNPDSGSIEIDNIDFTHLFQQRQKLIGYIPQNVKLFESTILDNIRYTCESNMSKQNIEKWVKDHGAESVLKKDPNDNDYLLRHVGTSGSKLSGGQKQIIIILRTFLANVCTGSNKKIFILDEPTSALDHKTTQIVINLLKKLSKKYTILIITHDINVSQKCDYRIYI